MQRYDQPVTPAVTAQDEFFEFLFSGADTKYAALKEAASKREPLPHFALKNVKITVNVDADYSIASTRLTRNVVGIVEGSDPKLKDTYVLFGAHYDHIGYTANTPAAGRGGAGVGGGAGGAGGCVGQTRDTPRPGDVINNGADDDGSGTVGVMAVARAFALGPKPKRSVMFVWHSGEESGLYGSRYMADYPIVPLDKVAAQLNIDMIGRNRCDEASEANTVYLVGSDRISTELHNLNEDTNKALPTPLKLDYEYNDPADPESIYTRSDHYSYASKGIPIIFYTTGLHKDYHYVTDEVSKIEFPKMAHIAQLVYETGLNLANLDHFPGAGQQGTESGEGSDGEDQVSRRSAVFGRQSQSQSSRQSAVAVAVGSRGRQSSRRRVGSLQPASRIQKCERAGAVACAGPLVSVFELGSGYCFTSWPRTAPPGLIPLCMLK